MAIPQFPVTAGHPSGLGAVGGEATGQGVCVLGLEGRCVLSGGVRKRLLIREQPEAIDDVKGVADITLISRTCRLF